MAMFEGLLSGGLLLYADTQAELVSHDGFQVSNLPALMSTSGL